MANSQFETLVILARRDLQMLRLAMSDADLQSPALFHAQQAIEKAFKAILSAHACPYPLTHNLLVLKKALIDISIDCTIEDDILRKILPFGVEARYDEEIEPLISTDQALAAAMSALARAEQFRPLSIDGNAAASE